MATKEKGLTPMMKQFFTLKAKHPDALMLFRCGDFYETYCEDAVAASKILGITLTRRNNVRNRLFWHDRKAPPWVGNYQ